MQGHRDRRDLGRLTAMPEDVTRCGQSGCGKRVLWGRTVRQLDEATKEMKGGRPMMLDWPLPDPANGRSLAMADGTPIPNLGVRRDGHGTWWIRVVTVKEPIRDEERPAVPHWATCVNPPKREKKAPAGPRPKKAPAGQVSLFDDVAVPAPKDLRPALLSDASLFPRRRRG
jgi:hypothetical protein